MMMRVKLVIIRIIAGRNDSIVSSSIVCTLSEYVVPPLGPGLALKAGRPAVRCAKAAYGINAMTTGRASFIPRTMFRLTCITCSRLRDRSHVRQAELLTTPLANDGGKRGG